MKETDLIRNDPYLNKLITENGLTEEYIEENLPVFLRVLRSRSLCEGCTDIGMCRQSGKTMRSALSFDTVLIEEKERCPFGRTIDQRKELREKYIWCDIPEELLDLDLFNIVPKTNQRQLFTELFDIYEERRKKGLFVSGTVGTGKSYNCTALANSLVKKGKRVAYIKASNFFNDLKSRYSDFSDSIDSIINRVKNADYLFLDDLGSEAVSEFVRDDVLFRILDHRMENRKLTVFISNYGKKDLFRHYQYDRRDNPNTMNATRLMERISILSDDYVLTGKDLREEDYA
jgi:primosomal protein DnaI